MRSRTVLWGARGLDVHVGELRSPVSAIMREYDRVLREGLAAAGVPAAKTTADLTRALGDRRAGEVAADLHRAMLRVDC